MMQRLSDRSSSRGLNNPDVDDGEDVFSRPLPRGGLIGDDSTSSPSSPPDNRPVASGPSNGVANLPHQPAHHRVVHRAGTLPDDHQQPWRALAARINFPHPSTNHAAPANNHRRLSNGFRPPPPHHSPAKRVHPTRPPGEPLLGDERIVDRDHDVDWYVEKYNGHSELEERAQQLMHGAQQEVFQWWFKRVTDRMERKAEHGGTEMDFHEKVVSRLNMVAHDEYSYAIVNYFAEMMVPKHGFTVGQVEEYRRDPGRWDRRNCREEEFDMDESGELRAAWREKSIGLAQRKYQQLHRKLEAQRRADEMERRRQWRKRIICGANENLDPRRD